MSEEKKAVEASPAKKPAKRARKKAPAPKPEPQTDVVIKVDGTDLVFTARYRDEVIVQRKFKKFVGPRALRDIARLLVQVLRKVAPIGR